MFKILKKLKKKPLIMDANYFGPFSLTPSKASLLSYIKVSSLDMTIDFIKSNSIYDIIVSDVCKKHNIKKEDITDEIKDGIMEGIQEGINFINEINQKNISNRG